MDSGDIGQLLQRFEQAKVPRHSGPRKSPEELVEWAQELGVIQPHDPTPALPSDDIGISLDSGPEPELESESEPGSEGYPYDLNDNDETLL